MCVIDRSRKLFRLKMTSVIKCSTCNIVIDELLAFVQNKISVIDDDSLIQILKSSFKSDEIKRSKSLLFESVPTEKRNITRKKVGKETRDLEDIISLFRGSNMDMRPVFVARDLEKLPPVTFDHVDVTKMLKELVLLQSEIKDIRSSFVTKDQLNNMKAEILKSVPSTSTLDQSFPSCWRNINVNMRRGGNRDSYVDSGPIGLSNLNMTVTENSNIINNNNILSPKRSNEERSFQEYPLNTDDENKTKQAITVSPTDCETGLICQTVGDQLSAISTPNKSVIQNKHKNEFYRPPQGIISKPESETGWRLVQRRKHKLSYRYHSKTGRASENIGKFKAAENKVPIFITKVHKDTTEQDITDYIHDKTQENILLERISMRQEKEHNAYKFFVSESKLSMFLNDSLWPKGIIFRRFMHFKQRTAVYGTVNLANGR